MSHKWIWYINDLLYLICISRQEEERQRLEEEEQRRREEEEMRLAEEARRIEHERFLRAVEEEDQRKRDEEERLDNARREARRNCAELCSHIYIAYIKLIFILGLSFFFHSN